MELGVWKRWSNRVGPREDAPLQVENFAETGFGQEAPRLGGALPAAAMRHNYPRRIQLVDASCQLAKRDQVALKIADLILVGVAHVENEEIVSTIEPGFQIAWRNLRHLHRRAGSFFAANAAEFVVIDEFVNRAMRAAHGAVRVLAQLELAEFHSQCVKQEQAANEIVPTAENELDCFHRRDRANDPGQNAEHSAFRAGRHESRRRRVRIEATGARPILRAENT